MKRGCRDCGTSERILVCGWCRQFTHTWAWKIRPDDMDRRGMMCRVLRSGARGSVLVEFSDGKHFVTSRRGLRRIKNA